MSDTPDFNDKNFQIWLRYNEVDFEELSETQKKEKWDDFKKNHTKGDRLNVSQNQVNNDEKKNIVIHEEHNQPVSKNTNWIEEKRDSWQPWCEKEHNPPYIYEENKEFKTGLEFDVYKTQKDKEEGQKAASIHYESERDVTITTEQGKAPDYEFFDKLTKEAKSDNIPGITFEGEMTPEFKARLAVACLENGLNIENGPENIDANLLGKDINSELKRKIELYNKAQKYQQMKKKAEKHNTTEPFDLSTIEDKSDKAIAFAAYKNAGVEVTGLEDSGLVHAPDLYLFPKEAKNVISKNNEDILKARYEKLQEQAANHDKNQPFDLSTLKDKNDKVLAFAAYKNANIEVTGLTSPQNQDGLLQTQDLSFMPEDVKETVIDHNYGVREQQVARLKARREELKADAKTSTEIKEAIEEREKTEAARNAVRGKKGQERTDFLEQNEEHAKYLGKRRKIPNVQLLKHLTEKSNS